MLTLFFIIIFLAELIITSWIVSGLRKADAIVCEMNLQVTKSREELKEKLNKTKAVINLAKLSLDYLITFVKEKKTNFEHFFKKNLLTTILFLILRIPEKKITRYIDIFVILKQAYNKIFTK